MKSKDVGYTNPLFILPFDHRGSFLELFGYAAPLAPEQEKSVREAKWIIYEGFKSAVSENAPPKAHAAILVDEQFGDAVLRAARDAGYITILATEKSGQDEFNFEYGERFGEHIEKYEPAFVKALIRYNPEGDQELNARQRARLKRLSEYARGHGYKLLIEPLIPGTQDQLAGVGNDTGRYDNEIRYGLAKRMIQELQDGGVEPDVWKIEGLEDPMQYEAVVGQALSGGRDKVRAVILGRGAERAQEEKWLRAGARVYGISGFAIGRTIFWDAISRFKDGQISAGEAAAAIARNFEHYYRVFIAARGSGQTNA